MAINEEYPFLEYLIIAVPFVTEDEGTALVLPGTLRAPHLCHRLLYGLTYLLSASSHPFLSWATRPPTSSQLFFSDGFRSCPS